MHTGALGQAALLGLEALLIAALLLTMFRLRHIFGLAPVYTTLGVFSQIAALLTASVYIRFADNFVIGPGSIVLFPAILFAVLFVYIREDAQAARQSIYAMMAANIAISLLALLVVFQLKSELIVNPLALPVGLFLQQPRIMIVGSLTLLADTILIILLYEYLGGFLRRNLFARIFVSLSVVLIFDTTVFVTGCFFEAPNYSAILISNIIGKSVAAVLYAGLLTIYLQRFDVAEATDSEGRGKLKDLFQILTYREKYEALRLQSRIDALTGVHNRGYFDAEFLACVTDARHLGSSVTVLLIDVDHFKAINDTRGHAEGDRVLIAVATAIRNTARASDIVARYGGEEFALLLPDTVSTAGEELAERIRQAVPLACQHLNAPSGAPPTTITIGIATTPMDTGDGSALLSIADQRLYAGKKAGRNRVVSSTAPLAQVA